MFVVLEFHARGVSSPLQTSLEISRACNMALLQRRLGRLRSAADIELNHLLFPKPLMCKAIQTLDLRQLD